MPKIYTKKGDTGSSSTLLQCSIPKDSEVFKILGSLDLVNANLGLTNAEAKKELSADTFIFKESLPFIQGILFCIGSFIAGYSTDNFVSSIIKATEKLEEEIDIFQEKFLPPLTNFILPGGSVAASYFHLSRAEVRNLERALVTFFKKYDKITYITSEEHRCILAFINRLSDYCFCAARYVNVIQDIEETIWSSK